MRSISPSATSASMAPLMASKGSLLAREKAQMAALIQSLE